MSSMDSCKNISNIDAESDPSFSKNSCQGLRPISRELTNQELTVVDDELIHKNVTSWTRDMALLPAISQSFK